MHCLRNLHNSVCSDYYLVSQPHVVSAAQAKKSKGYDSLLCRCGSPCTLINHSCLQVLLLSHMGSFRANHMGTLEHSIVFLYMLISVQFDCYPAFIHLLCCSMIYFCDQLHTLFMLGRDSICLLALLTYFGSVVPHLAPEVTTVSVCTRNLGLDHCDVWDCCVFLIPF